jgi:hypothetical protein
VTKDYPDDEVRGWTGHEPREPAVEDASVSDKVIAHPAYGRQGWLAVVNPGAANGNCGS